MIELCHSHHNVGYGILGDAGGERLLANVLISFCNAGPLRPILGVYNTDAQQFAEVTIPYQASVFGATGIYRAGTHYYVVLQHRGARSSLLVLNQTLSTVAHYPLHMVRDGHSLVVRNGEALVVSTGTDSIIRVRGIDQARVEETGGCPKLVEFR